MQFIGNCVYGKNASTVEDLKELLASNPDMLERFIVEAVNLETLERWLQKKTEMMNLPSRLTSGKNKLADWKVITMTITMTMTMFVPTVLGGVQQARHVGGADLAPGGQTQQQDLPPPRPRHLHQRSHRRGPGATSHVSDTLVHVPAPGQSLHPLHRGPHLGV